MIKLCKRCSTCKETKDTSAFSKNRCMKDGHASACKPCDSIRAKKWRQNNTEAIAKKRKVYHAKIKDKRLKYYRDNVEKITTYQKEYRKTHLEQDRIYRKNRRDTDPIVKLRLSLRVRLNRAIELNSKTGSAVRDLGCSIEEFKVYMESLFLPEMTWGNWGRGADKWHIDHIMPLCSFDLTQRAELLKAVHYTNLRPLWEQDNLRKLSEDLKLQR